MLNIDIQDIADSVSTARADGSTVGREDITRMVMSDPSIEKLGLDSDMPAIQAAVDAVVDAARTPEQKLKLQDNKELENRITGQDDDLEDGPELTL